MTSTVTNYSNLIDTTYPIAGIDNDTQGFRTNFAAIKNAFTATANEISDLQLTVSNSITTSTAFATAIATTVTNAVTATIYSYVNGIISTSTAYASVAPINATGDSSHRKGMIYATSTTMYICYKDYDGSSSIWAKVNTTAW